MTVGNGTRLYILGAGTPTPTAVRFGSSQVVQVGDELLMFDCGPAATHKLVKAGLWPTNVDYLFFTHHHFDHDVDYPCFLLCRWDQGAGKEKQLTVRGPRLTERLTHRILDEEQGAFSHDWLARVNAPPSQHVFVNRGGTLPRRPPSVDAQDVAPGVVYSGRDWQVTAAPAEHVQPWLDSLAYRIDTPSGSIVITGDTQPCQSVLDLARDADMLVCMCWDDQAVMEECGEATGQTGTTGAANMAREANAKTLVLTHMGPHISSQGPLEKGLADIGRLYDGRVVVAEELLTLDLRP
jgi:ribonuclease Z